MNKEEVASQVWKEFMYQLEKWYVKTPHQEHITFNEKLINNGPVVRDAFVEALKVYDFYLEEETTEPGTKQLFDEDEMMSELDDMEDVTPVTFSPSQSNGPSVPFPCYACGRQVNVKPGILCILCGSP